MRCTKTTLAEILKRQETIKAHLLAMAAKENVEAIDVPAAKFEPVDLRGLPARSQE